MTKFSTALSAAAFVALSSPASAISIIDDFTTGRQVVSDLSSGTTQPTASEVEAIGALGGFRDMRVVTDGSIISDTSLFANPSATATSAITGEPVNGTLAFGNNPNVLGTGFIVYDGEDAGTGNEDGSDIDITGLNGVDLTNSGATDAFFFDYVLSDGDLEITVDVWDMAGNQATYVEEVDVTGLINPFLFFSDPLWVNAENTDFSDVGALAFKIEGTTVNRDGILASISVVPLPASALLLLGGLSAFAGVSSSARRRRRKA